MASSKVPLPPQTVGTFLGDGVVFFLLYLGEAYCVVVGKAG